MNDRQPRPSEILKSLLNANAGRVPSDVDLKIAELLPVIRTLENSAARYHDLLEINKRIERENRELEEERDALRDKELAAQQAETNRRHKELMTGGDLDQVLAVPEPVSAIAKAAAESMVDHVLAGQHVDEELEIEVEVEE